MTTKPAEVNSSPTLNSVLTLVVSRVIDASVFSVTTLTSHSASNVETLSVTLTLNVVSVATTVSTPAAVIEEAVPSVRIVKVRFLVAALGAKSIS